MSCCRTGGTKPTEVHQAAQTRRVSNAAMRWPMHATKAHTRRPRASRVIAALPVIATTFVMHAIVGRASCQLKMPCPDAYYASAERRVYSGSIRKSSFGLGSK